MRLTCPACDASYDVPDAMLAPARKVRCAKCHQAWAPVPAEPEPALLPDMEGGFDDGFAAGPPMEAPPPPIEEPAPTARFEPLRADHPERLAPVLAPSRKGRVALALAWVASVALLACLAYAAVGYRAVIVKRWPPSERAYAMLGLSHR